MVISSLGEMALYLFIVIAASVCTTILLFEINGQGSNILHNSIKGEL